MRSPVAAKILEETPQEVKDKVRIYAEVLLDLVGNPQQPVIKNPIDYFPNEQADYTITLHGEPIAVTFNEDEAIRLKNSFSALTLRIDVLQKMLGYDYNR